MRVIAIDPSIHNLGIALSDANRNVIDAVLIKSGSVNEANWQSAASAMAEAVVLTINTALLEEPGDTWIAVSEMPENWFGSRGEKSKDNEAVQKLYYYVGYQMCFLHSHFPKVPMFLVTPSRWKGQTPKAVTMKRVLRILAQQGINKDKIDNNVADAIMIGQYAYDNFNRLTPIQRGDISTSLIPVI